jgi:hypothetical protein
MDCALAHAWGWYADLLLVRLLVGHTPLDGSAEMPGL